MFVRRAKLAKISLQDFDFFFFFVFRALFDNMSQKSSMFELISLVYLKMKPRIVFISGNRTKYWFLY